LTGSNQSTLNAFIMKKSMILTASVVTSLYTYSQGKVGINTINPSAILHVKDSSAVFTGFNPLLNESLTGNPPISGPGSRMMWYADKAAFRAGYVDDNRWDKSLTGRYSFAAGNNAMASGSFSIAMGLFAEASGDLSVALGSGKAESNFSTAIGISARTTYNNAVSIGTSTRAAGQYATAMGAFTVSNAYNCFVAGRFNDSVSTNLLSPFDWIDTDPLFILGNGANNNARRNAITVLKNGFTGINTSSPQAMLHVKDSSILFTGVTGLPGFSNVPPAHGAGVRMMWYPDRAAFRSGFVNDNQWDRDNIGVYSFAAGSNVMAKEHSSIALGNSSKALRIYSIALGGNAIASGEYSATIGHGTVARSYASLSAGSYNDSIATSSSTDWTATDPVFIVGNGTADNQRSNAMIVLKNARTGINTSSPDAMLHVVRNAPSGGPLHSNAKAIFESDQVSYMQLSSLNNHETGILSGNTSTNIRSALIFNSDSSIVLRTGGNNTKITISKEGELQRPSTGSANMVPICYGSVSSTGAINSGTSNFTVTNPANGQYDISITGENYSSSTYVTNVTAVSSSNLRVASTIASGGDLIVRIWDATGALVSGSFHFIVYKQ
jgi:hypothetical protein